MGWTCSLLGLDAWGRRGGADIAAAWPGHTGPLLGCLLLSTTATVAKIGSPPPCFKCAAGNLFRGKYNCQCKAALVPGGRSQERQVWAVFRKSSLVNQTYIYLFLYVLDVYSKAVYQMVFLWSEGKEVFRGLASSQVSHLPLLAAQPFSSHFVLGYFHSKSLKTCYNCFIKPLCVTIAAPQI